MRYVGSENGNEVKGEMRLLFCTSYEVPWGNMALSYTDNKLCAMSSLLMALPPRAWLVRILEFYPECCRDHSGGQRCRRRSAAKVS